jgi:hypothetical protein
MLAGVIKHCRTTAVNTDIVPEDGQAGDSFSG